MSQLYVNVCHFLQWYLKKQWTQVAETLSFVVSDCHFHQYPALTDYYKFILVTILILMTLIEAIRLYLGYAGNLHQKVLHFSHDTKIYL